MLAVLLVAGGCWAAPNAIENYEQARPVFWAELYPDGGSTLYCGLHFVGGYQRAVNIEHVFPMGWVTRSLACGTRKQCRERSRRFNLIEADLHNLYPVRREINDARGSFRFGMVPGEARRFGDCDFEVDQRQRRVEPREAARGEIARAMLYMQRRYGLLIYRSQGRLLLDWHFQDPPSAHERWRNDVIEKIQGNRNPFIDDPDLARTVRF